MKGYSKIDELSLEFTTRQPLPRKKNPTKLVILACLTDSRGIDRVIATNTPSSDGKHMVYTLPTGNLDHSSSCAVSDSIETVLTDFGLSGRTLNTTIVDNYMVVLVATEGRVQISDDVVPAQHIRRRRDTYLIQVSELFREGLRHQETLFRCGGRKYRLQARLQSILQMLTR
jgi:hypothetical protein